MLARACALGATWCAGFALAAEIVDPAVSRAEVSASERRAAQWGMSEVDWTRYEELMRGRRGLWTPDADPLLVLGAHARTAGGAAPVRGGVRTCRVRPRRGRTGLRARGAGGPGAKLFPGQPRVAALQATSAATRIAVLVDRHCADCGGMVRRHARGDVPVDVYVRGASDDGDLRAWVTEQELDVTGIVAGEVTINHLDAAGVRKVPGVWSRGGDGRWTALE